jgi:hypothetical protein
MPNLRSVEVAATTEHLDRRWGGGARFLYPLALGTSLVDTVLALRMLRQMMMKWLRRRTPCGYEGLKALIVELCLRFRFGSTVKADALGVERSAAANDFDPITGHHR